MVKESNRAIISVFSTSGMCSYIYRRRPTMSFVLGKTNPQHILPVELKIKLEIIHASTHSPLCVNWAHSGKGLEVNDRGAWTEALPLFAPLPFPSFELNCCVVYFLFSLPLLISLCLPASICTSSSHSHISLQQSSPEERHRHHCG